MLKHFSAFDNHLMLRDCPLQLYPHVNMIGAPVNCGQPKDGTRLGPGLIRDSDIIQFLSDHVGVTVVDHGDLELETRDYIEEQVFGMRNVHRFIDNTCTISKRVEELLQPAYSLAPSAPLVILGGDHSLATGSILGHCRAKPDACVIWVDAHADLNTPLTSQSGNMHGMPVAFLMDELQEEVPYMEELEPIETCLKAKDIAYIGLHDLDAHEAYDLRKNNIAHFTMMDVDQMGIEKVIQTAIEAVNPRLERPIHLSFDIDAMDPTLAPSTGTPVPGGLTLREGLRICEVLYSTGKLSVVDLAEINPLLGTKEDVERTKQTGVRLLKAALGYRRDGHLPVKVHSLANEGIRSRADKEKRMVNCTEK